MILTSRFLTPEGKLFIGLLGILLFWIGNLYFLHMADQQQIPEHLHSISDFYHALKHWQKKSNPFYQEIRMAIQQLEAFHRKQRTLLAFDSSFQSISSDTEAYLLSNMKKILRRMLMMNQHDHSPLNRIYLCSILDQNQKVLHQYDCFLSEVFLLDTHELPCLDTITQALRDMRKFS